jgi:uncharacterized glyoxalase superfamily protein PhnB
MQPTRPVPADWPRISSALFYNDAAAAIRWLGEAFGFEVRILVEHAGHIQHSELTYGEGVIMVAQADSTAVSPQSVQGGNTQSLCVYIDDAVAHCTQARAAGATILREPTLSDYGPEYWADLTYQAADPEGHRWWFMQRIRSQPAAVEVKAPGGAQGA